MAQNDTLLTSITLLCPAVRRHNLCLHHAATGQKMSESNTRVSATAGNTPLETMPEDYLPEGAQARWLQLAEGPDSGKKLFFYDVCYGEGAPQATVLFVHGNPESSYTYRQTIDALRSGSDKPVRIVAVDHIGFGFSDQASFEMVDFHHAANLWQLVSYLDLRDITLVIHDWGGAIGTGALLQEPERVKALVLMNTTVFPIPMQGMTYRNFPFPGFMAWNRLGHWMPWRLWRFIPPLVMFSPASRSAFVSHVGGFIWRALRGQLTPKEKLYRDMFVTRSNALSSMRNVKQTDRWGHGYRYFDAALGWQDNHDFYRQLQENLPNRWGNAIEARAFFGLYDPCGRPDVQDQWLAALPQLAGNIQQFEHRGHFIEEHEFDAIAGGILSASGLQ